jgi:hypothetical protein
MNPFIRSVHGGPRFGRQCFGGAVQFLHSRFGPIAAGSIVDGDRSVCLAAILWFVLLGWIIHLWSILDAALFKPPS